MNYHHYIEFIIVAVNVKNTRPMRAASHSRDASPPTADDRE
ncbi:MULTISPECIES: hypothetical protein [Paraburkholderia]|nr:hypothetical protein [Paraburkholderia fungorum]